MQISNSSPQASDSPNISSGNQSNVTKHLRLYDNAQFFDHLLNITKYNPRVRPDTTVEVEHYQKAERAENNVNLGLGP